jgi:hypothetical protein
MYSLQAEERLISVDIVNILSDRCSIQLDIDPTRVKASALIAQDIDLGDVLTEAQIERARNPVTAADEVFRELVIPAWAFYTYARCISLNTGSFTDSGYVLEKEVGDIESILYKTEKSIISIAIKYLGKVLAFLDNETPDIPSTTPGIKLRIKTMGGEENRASN